MGRKQQKYSLEQKQTILSLYKSGEKTQEQLLTEYQIPRSTFDTWLKQSEEVTLPDGRVFTVKDLLSLEKQCKELEKENNFLKKTALRFSL